MMEKNMHTAFAEAQNYEEIMTVYNHRRAMLDEEFRANYYKYCKAASAARKQYASEEKRVKNQIHDIELRLATVERAARNEIHSLEMHLVTERERRDNLLFDASSAYKVQCMAGNNQRHDLSLQKCLRMAQLDIVVIDEKKGGEI